MIKSTDNEIKRMTLWGVGFWFACLVFFAGIGIAHKADAHHTLELSVLSQGVSNAFEREVKPSLLFNTKFNKIIELQKASNESELVDNVFDIFTPAQIFWRVSQVMGVGDDIAHKTAIGRGNECCKTGVNNFELLGVELNHLLGRDIVNVVDFDISWIVHVVNTSLGFELPPTQLQLGRWTEQVATTATTNGLTEASLNSPPKRFAAAKKKDAVYKYEASYGLVVFNTGLQSRHWILPEQRQYTAVQQI